MKNVYIVHGWDGSPGETMLQWLKSAYEKKGYTVAVPAMPDPAIPKIEGWVQKLKDIVKPDGDTVLIGHSIGCQAILRYLETAPAGVIFATVILIAPWMELDKQTMKDEGEGGIAIAQPWITTSIDFPAVKSHIGRTLAIFSDNDPYVPLAEKEIFERELGAEIIVEHARGHFTAGDGVDHSFRATMISIAQFRKLVWSHFRAHGRHAMPWRKTRDPYRILVSEVMLQQTQVARVEKFYGPFVREFRNFRALARAKTADVLRAWQGLGYNRRALSLVNKPWFKITQVSCHATGRRSNHCRGSGRGRPAP
jgi:predicted alpha/beta hydrolase family esterase